MFTGINESKTLIIRMYTNYLTNVNVHLMEENLIQINGEITINVVVSVKNVMFVKKKICLGS